MVANDIDGILNIFVADGWWRDMLALTWDFRTFRGANAIKTFLSDRLALVKFDKVQFLDASLQRPFPDLAWIRGRFSFKTAIGFGDGVFHLVPLRDGTWRAFAVYTNLWNLIDHPEKVGLLRNSVMKHGKWKEQREKEVAFADSDPKVLVMGAGQSGLEIAARLKFLDVPTLIVDKQACVGDTWRQRYDTMCLHDPVCEFLSYICGVLVLIVSSLITGFDQFPYLP